MSPPRNCALCPRLVAYRNANQERAPEWHNAPVPSFGSLEAQLLIIGQAPGVNGANKTGRPFTGDYAGHLLYATLLKFGFASGQYAESPDDGLVLVNCRVTNAVRCAPPQHKLETSDKKTCNPYLTAEIAAMKNLSIILAIGGVAHEMALKALCIKAGPHKFTHGKIHEIKAGLIIVDSYHVSRYNTNTRRLDAPMFESVVANIRERLAA